MRSSIRTWTLSPASLPIVFRSAALTGESVRAVALRHQRARKRLAIDGTADLDKPAGTEELEHIVDHHARPRTGVVALLKSAVELTQHDPRDFRTQPNSSPNRPLTSLSLRRCDDDLDAVDEEPACARKACATPTASDTTQRGAADRRCVRQWHQGDDVSTLFEVSIETPLAAGTLLMSEWSTVRDGKVAAASVVFDTAAFPKLVPEVGAAPQRPAWPPGGWPSLPALDGSFRG